MGKKSHTLIRELKKRLPVRKEFMSGGNPHLSGGIPPICHVENRNHLGGFPQNC